MVIFSAIFKLTWLSTLNIKESGKGKARCIGGYDLRAIILSTILAAHKKPPTRALTNLPTKKEVDS